MTRPSESFVLDPAELLRHDAWLRALVRTLVGDADADDVVQQTWLQVLRRPGSGVRAPRAWLGGVARHTARRGHRARVRRAERERAAARDEELPPTEVTVQQLEAQRQVTRAVTALPEPYRTAVLLRYFHDRSTAEIVRRTQTSEANVRQRIKRGLDQLRTALAESYGPRWRHAPALCVLAVPRGGGAVAGGVASSLSVTGAVAMTTKIILLCAAVVLTVVGIWWWTGTAGLAVTETAAATSADGTAPPSAEGEGEPTEVAAARVPLGMADPAAAAARVAMPDAVRHGRVVGAGGQPLAGVPLRAADDPAALATSGADGTFTLLGVAAAVAELRATGDFATLHAASLRGLGEDAQLLVVAAPRVAVAGFVQTPDGVPVAGVEVEYFLPGLHELPLAADHTEAALVPVQHTDRAGRFRFEGLPNAGSVAFRHRDHATDALAVPAAGDERLVVVLRPVARPPWTVTGRVLAPGGALLADALVGLGPFTTRTDGYGQFRLEVAATATADLGMDLYAAKAGWQTAVLRGARQRLFASEARALELDVMLPGEALTIDGVVVAGDGSGRAGMLVYPWAGEALNESNTTQAEVWTAEDLAVGLDAEVLAGVGRGVRAFARTGADGRFRLAGLRARGYVLRVFDATTGEAWNSGEILAGARGVTLTAPAAVLLDRLRGRVVGDDGAAVVGARVALAVPNHRLGTRTSLTPLGEATTDGRGGFTLRGVPRAARLSVRADGVLPGSFEVERLLDRAPAEAEHELVVGVRRAFRLVLTEPPPDGEMFAMLDAEGQQLPIYEIRPRGSSSSTYWQLVGGRSEVLWVGAAAHTLVVTDMHGAELVRYPVTLGDGCTEIRG